MIRHSVFALVLVGAAFAGGAAINGPGLTWLQRTILGGPTIIVDGSSDAPSMASKKASKPSPTARPWPMVVDLPRAPQQQPQQPKMKPIEPEPAAREPEPLLPPESPSAPASALIRPVEPPAPDPGPAPPSAPAPVLVRQAPAATRPKLPANLNLSPAPKTDPVARLASAEATSTPPAPSASADPSTPPDWAEIRKRMQALGIARYSMEAEIDGRVRFSCVIPVDGLRAVGHQFEAEGDDEYQAAEVALRRVALWQATELSPPPSPRRTQD
jgi:hypothetical protein